MTSLIQRHSNHSLAGLTCSDSFTGALLQGSGVLAAVTWIDTANNTNPYPDISVADGIGTYDLLRSVQVGLGGDVWLGVFMARYRNAGALGPVTATATLTGLMIISLHEVAPNAGEILKFDQGGTEFDIGFTGTFSDLGNTVGTSASLTYNQTEYQFCVWATRSGDITPNGFGGGVLLTNREHHAAGPTGTLLGGITGSQTTFDRSVNDYPGGSGANLTWSSGSPVMAACIFVSIASIAPVADKPLCPSHADGNEYAGVQSVVLTQDQGFEIHYTLDGSTPTSSSALYSAPLSIATATTIKAIAHEAAGGFYPTGFFADSPVLSLTIDVYTGTCTNPAHVIDGDDTSFATLTCTGAGGDIVGVEARTMSGTTGGPGSVFIDYEVVQNDLVAPSQTLPAWKVCVTIGATEHIISTGVVGAGPQARAVGSFPIPPGTVMNTVRGKVFAICQIPGSTGGVQLKVYGIYLTLI